MKYIIVPKDTTSKLTLNDVKYFWQEGNCFCFQFKDGNIRRYPMVQSKVRCEAYGGTGWHIIGGGEIVDREPCPECENGLRSITAEDLRESAINGLRFGCGIKTLPEWFDARFNQWLRERYGIGEG